MEHHKLWIRWRCITLPPSKFATLFGLVHCPILTMRVSAYFASTSKPMGGLHLVLLHISQYIFLKTATITTYHSISIAVPRYIDMQLSSYIT